MMSTAQKIKILLSYRNMSQSQLADKMNISRQKLCNKFKRNNFSEDELILIAKILDCTYYTTFEFPDGFKV
ncbi:MAG: helix-turn-helix transcriptional regulator [Christensenellales bacterium]